MTGTPVFLTSLRLIMLVEGLALLGPGGAVRPGGASPLSSAVTPPCQLSPRRQGDVSVSCSAVRSPPSSVSPSSAHPSVLITCRSVCKGVRKDRLKL